MNLSSTTNSADRTCNPPVPAPEEPSESLRSRGRLVTAITRRASALLTGLPILSWQTVFYLGGLVVLILMTFWTVQNYRLTPGFSLRNWSNVLTSELFHSVYLNTLFYAGLAAIVATLLGGLFAYALAFKVSERVRRTAMLLLIIPFFTSLLIRDYAWIFLLAEDGLINYVLRALGHSGFKMYGTLFSLIVGYQTYMFHLVTLVMLLSFSNVDRRLIEAGNNLGAGRVRSVFSVVIPTAKIGVVFGFSFAFMLALGDLVGPTLVGAGTHTTLSIMIVDATKGSANFPKAATIGVVMLVTLLVLTFGSFRLAFPPKRGQK